MRRYDLDNLRVIAFGSLIFYHVGMVFVPWPNHIKDVNTYEGLVFPMLFLNQWRLSILFVISGMGTYFAMSKRTVGQLAKERLKRLLIPLLFGMLFVVPPQVYFEWLDKGIFKGNYLQFYLDRSFWRPYPQGGPFPGTTSGLSCTFLYFRWYSFRSSNIYVKIRKRLS